MYEDLLRALEDDIKHISNIVDGEYRNTKKRAVIINPLDGTPMFDQPDTQVDEITPFLRSLAKCPKSGRHNPIKNVERYKMLGEVSFKTAMALSDPKVEDYFTRLVQGVMPKSYSQALGEPRIVAEFLKNFCGDRPRFLAAGSTTPGDHFGQQPQDYQWPYGPVVIITPFNFPLEIPVLQLMGALYMGNKPLIKSATTVSVVIDQFLSLLHWCGLPMEDVDLIHCRGSVMNELLKMGSQKIISSKEGEWVWEDFGMGHGGEVWHPKWSAEERPQIIRLVQFTGSSKVAEEISQIMRGKVRIEDAGFDWKIIGPDFKKENLDYVAWQCDQDAYAASGQKCSATSILFVHGNWRTHGFFEKLATLAKKRNLKDLTVGPVLSWTTEAMLEHIKSILFIPGTHVLFGGKPLIGHHIPECYGAIEPTAVYVPLKEISGWESVTTEIFGPVQIITSYGDKDIPLVLDILERMENHLTAAVVSDDPVFTNKILGSTVNGTTYAGIRARTTGAPQNHWFGPCGDPRGAGIGTPQAIINTWSSPRCIIRDVGPIDYSAKLVQS